MSALSHRSTLGWILACAAGLGAPVHTARAEPPPIVVGQSLPLRGVSYWSAARVLQGTQAFAGYINATGGINGRRLEVVTLEDDNDPPKLAANYRTLARAHKAVAFINCLGDELCREASRVAEELRTPLVGPHSGAASLRSAKHAYTVPPRPEYAMQADALQRQLQSMGVTKVAILTSYPPEAELRKALDSSFSRGGARALVIPIDDSNAAGVDQAAARLRAAAPAAVVLDVSYSVMRNLGELEASQRFTWPSILATVSPGTLTQLTQEIRSRTIGLVNIVPNPEDNRLPLSRELDAHAERYSGPLAVTFEGMEGYVNLRLLVEALRRCGPAPTPESTMRAIENLREQNLGGFFLRIDPSAVGPNWLDLGMRWREGRFVR